MKKHQVTARAARIHAGVLILSAEQAKPRLHNLKTLSGKGRYEIVQPVEFKLGEVIGYEGDLPKALAVFVEEQLDMPKALHDESEDEGNTTVGKRPKQPAK